MIVERCKVNGCTLQHPSDGSIRLFDYKTVVTCKQCGAESTDSATNPETAVRGIQERTHVCDICHEPLDVYEDAVKFSCASSAGQGMDRVELEVHPRCAVNAGTVLMTKFARQKEPELERGARKPKWWDGLWQILGGGKGTT